jgi:cell division protein FtsZ
MLKKSDEVLYHAVRGISDLILVSGLINLDFADVRTVMGEAGTAMMGAGVASGESRAKEAAMKAITSPLLEDVSIDGARAVLMNVTGSYDVTMEEVAEAMSIIEDASEDAQIFFGVVLDETMEDEIRITVIATGIEGKGAYGGDNVGGTVKIFPQRGGAANQVSAGQGAIKSVPPAAPSGGWSLTSEEGVGVPRPVRSYAEGNRDVPSVMRRQGNTRAAVRETPRNSHAPGENDFVFDEDEFEIPSFIRKQAD